MEINEGNAEKRLQGLKEDVAYVDEDTKGGVSLLLNHHERMAAKAREMVALKNFMGWSYEQLATELGVCIKKIYQWEKLALFPFLRGLAK